MRLRGCARRRQYRERCHTLHEVAEADGLPHFALDPARLDDVADYVAAVIRANYPDRVIPYHARWRHFEVGGVDRWGDLANRLRGCDGAEQARTRIDLCTVSVLLDAGAGPAWSFREPETGQVLSRSEGLAVASLHAFSVGLFSGDPERPCRVDGDGLSRLSAAALGAALQVSDDNPLVGLQGRVRLLRNLANILRSRPDLFGADARVGALFDRWRAQAFAGALPARSVLVTLLDALAPIWPGRLTLGGENLGDVWAHPMLRGADPGGSLVPFHKLSQWLSYSVVEALQEAGINVSGLDALTGLAEVPQRWAVRGPGGADSPRCEPGSDTAADRASGGGGVAWPDGGVAGQVGAARARPVGVHASGLAAGAPVAGWHLGRRPENRARTASGWRAAAARGERRYRILSTCSRKPDQCCRFRMLLCSITRWSSIS